MAHDYVVWRDHRVFVSDTGSGDPLLLITGLGGNSEMWAPFSAAFAHRRVICFDAPGTGRSSAPMHPVPVASIADLARAVLDARQVPWADVVGFSYGGAVAQQFAFEHPARVRRLVLAATTSGLSGVPGDLNAIAGLLTPLRYYSPTYYDRTAAATFGGVTARDACVRRTMMAARQRRPPSPYGYAMQLMGAMGWCSWHFLPRIPHETLVICGDDDPLIPVANAERLAARIPNAQLDIVEGAGHLFLWDDGARLARRIAAFLDPDETDDAPDDEAMTGDSLAAGA